MMQIVKFMPEDYATVGMDCNRSLLVGLNELLEMIKAGVRVKVDMPREDKDMIINLLKED